jgi:hypothetical protein
VTVGPALGRVAWLVHLALDLALVIVGAAATPKANEHTKKVKAIAQKTLDEAHEVMDDKTVRAA